MLFILLSNACVQDKSFELSTDDSSFLNFASSGLDGPSPTSDGAADDVGGSGFVRPPPPSGALEEDPAPSFERPMPPSSTSMADLGRLSRPSSRPGTAEQSGNHEGARSMSPMSSDGGPDQQSTDFGFDTPKKTDPDDFFKKPAENVSLEEVGCPPVPPAGAARPAKVDQMSWMSLLYNYSQGTTMHGLPYITGSSRFVVRRLKRSLATQ